MIITVILSTVCVWVCGMKRVYVPVNEVVRETSLCVVSCICAEEEPKSKCYKREKKVFVDVRKVKNYSLLW